MRYNYLFSAVCMAYGVQQTGQLTVASSETASNAQAIAAAKLYGVGATNDSTSVDILKAQADDNKTVDQYTTKEEKKRRRALMFCCCCIGVTTITIAAVLGICAGLGLFSKSSDANALGNDEALAIPFYNPTGGDAVSLMVAIAGNTLQSTTPAIEDLGGNEFTKRPLTFHNTVDGIMTCVHALTVPVCFMKVPSAFVQVCGMIDGVCNGMVSQGVIPNSNGIMKMKGTWGSPQLRQFLCAALDYIMGSQSTVFSNFNCFRMIDLMFPEFLSTVYGMNALSGASQNYKTSTLNLGNNNYVSVTLQSGVGAYAAFSSVNGMGAPVLVKGITLDVNQKEFQTKAAKDAMSEALSTLTCTNMLYEAAGAYRSSVFICAAHILYTSTVAALITASNAISSTSTRSLVNSPSITGTRSTYSQAVLGEAGSIWTQLSVYHSPGVLYSMEVFSDQFDRFQDENARPLVKIVNTAGTAYVYYDDNGVLRTQAGAEIYDLPVDGTKMLVFPSGNEFVNQLDAIVYPVTMNNAIVSFTATP